MDIKEYQKDMFEWQKMNFPKSTSWQLLLGVGEEVGELNHAFLKRSQGIRGDSDQHTADIKDAVGDILIFLMNLCSLEGIDVEDTLSETWDQVRMRNWSTDPQDGG